METQISHPKSIGCFQDMLKQLISSEFSQTKSIDIKENFFELGVSSIQIVLIYAKIHECGIPLAPDKFMQCKNIEDIVNLYSMELESAAKVNNVNATDFQKEEDESLLPGQAWFLSEQFPEKNRFNISLSYECLVSINTDKIRLSWLKIVNTYPELTKKFNYIDGQYIKTQASPNELSFFEEIFLEEDAEKIEEAYKAHCNRIHSLIDIEKGVLLKLVLFRLPYGFKDRISVVIHHLACDGYSLDLLRNELWENYEKLAAGNIFLQSSNNNNNRKKLLQRMRGYLRQPEIVEKIAIWKDQILPNLELLPKADSITHNNNCREYTSFKMYEFSKEITDSIKNNAITSIELNVNDVLVLALNYALSCWSGMSEQLILNVHSARPLAMKMLNVDISHEVAWIALTTPLYIQGVIDCRDLEALRSAKRKLSEAFDLGVAYELGYFLDNKHFKLPRITTNKKVVLNFHGNTDANPQVESKYVRKTQGYGLGYGTINDRTTVFMINTWVSGGKLTLKWEYNSQIYEDCTIDLLIQNFVTYVNNIVDLKIE